MATREAIVLAIHLQYINLHMKWEMQECYNETRSTPLQSTLTFLVWLSLLLKRLQML